MSAYTITQGTDLPLEISNVVDEYGAAVSAWSGWSFEFRLSASEDSAALVAKTNVDATFVDAVDGDHAVVQFLISALETSALSTLQAHVYQVFLQSPGGVRQLVDSGTVTVTPAIP